MLETPSPVRVEQAVDGVVLEMRVSGCEDFAIWLDLSRVGGVLKRELPMKNLGTDRYQASVPLHWLTPERTWCTSTPASPHIVNASVIAECRADGRAARSEPIEFRYAAASHVVELQAGPVEALAAIDEENYLSLGANQLQWFTADSVRGHERRSGAVDEEKPVLLVGRRTAFLQDECPPDALCPSVTLELGDGSMLGYTSSRIRRYDVAIETGTLGLRDSLLVAGPVERMAVGADDQLHVVSADGTVLSRVLSNGEVELVRHLADDEHPSELAMSPSGMIYLTLSRSHPRFIRVRSATTGQMLHAFPMPGAGQDTKLSLSPQGDAWALIVEGELFLGAMDGSAVRIANDITPGAESHYLHLTWLNDALVVAHSKAVETYSRTAAPERLGRYELPAPSSDIASATILGLKASSEHVALVGAHGLRVLDAHGVVLGGADPLPCGLSATTAEWLSDGLLAFATGDTIWLQRYATSTSTSK